MHFHCDIAAVQLYHKLVRSTYIQIGTGKNFLNIGRIKAAWASICLSLSSANQQSLSANGREVQVLSTLSGGLHDFGQADLMLLQLCDVRSAQQ